MLTEIRQMAQRAISRLNNVLCRGILNTVTTGKRPTAKVSLLDDETYDGIEFYQDFGFICRPPEDGTTELLVGFLGGQRDQGVVLKSFNRTKSFKALNNIDLEEGEVAFWNKVAGNYIHLKANGDMLIQHHVAGTFIKILNDGSITVSSTSQSITIDTPELSVTGNLTVDGDVLDNANTNTNTVKEMRDIYNSHDHGGVSPGGSNTNDPNQTM
jgi:phage baseplate assembly protein V